MLVARRISRWFCLLPVLVASAHGCSRGPAPPTAAEQAALDEQARTEELKQFRSQVANDQVSFELIRTSADDTWMAELKGKPVVSLKIVNRPITDAGLANLAGNTEIKELLMEGTDITDAGMIHLATMPALESVSLSPKITDQGLAPLAGLKRLKVLNLGDTVTDAGLPHLAQLTQLEGLGPLTGVTGKGLDTLAPLTNLTGLNLFNAPITDDDLDKLKQFPKLSHLTLSGTKITDAGLLKLAELPKLQVVFLSSTAVTDAGVQALLKARSDLQGGITR